MLVGHCTFNSFLVGGVNILHITLTQATFLGMQQTSMESGACVECTDCTPYPWTVMHRGQTQHSQCNALILSIRAKQQIATNLFSALLLFSLKPNRFTLLWGEVNYAYQGIWRNKCLYQNFNKKNTYQLALWIMYVFTTTHLDGVCSSWCV